MSAGDNFGTARQIIVHLASDSSENIKHETISADAKVQEVGCCGDVPKVSKANSKKRDKLLEWLKNSQLKREENNRQVFSRWIDMVDNGAIDLMSLSNYPGKPSKSGAQFLTPGSIVTTANSETPLSPISPNSSALPSSSKPLSPRTIKPQTIPSANVCPQYFTPISAPNYYGITPNWFASNQAATIYSSMPLAQHQQVNMYPGSYCTSNPMLNNYYQYVPVQQPCTLCPSYVVPSMPANMDRSSNPPPGQIHPLAPIEHGSNLNIDANKWLEVLNDIKLSTPKCGKCEDDPGPLECRDCANES